MKQPLANQELMRHVESIVRPVSAAQNRKLRMRAELLAHLEATLEEERERVPGDEKVAFERAKMRLGEPTELTQRFKQSVPSVERGLMAKLPISPRWSETEERLGQLPGKQGRMTLGHITALSSLALLAFLPLLVAIHSILPASGEEPAHLILSLIGTLLGWPALMMASTNFVFSLASPDPRYDWPHALRRGSTVLALEIGFLCFLAFALANRIATPREAFLCAAVTLVFLSVSALISRQIGVLRRPYDEWLALDLA